MTIYEGRSLNLYLKENTGANEGISESNKGPREKTAFKKDNEENLKY